MSIIDTIKPPGPEQKGAAIAELADRAAELMAQIASATDQLAEVKASLIGQLGVKDEGSQSFHIEGNSGQQYKIKTIQSISRLVDAEQCRHLSQNLPAQIFDDLFTYKPTLKLGGYRAIRDTNPELLKLIDTALTSRPLPPRCDVEVINEDDTEVQP
jgi:hypothetical protein